MERPTKTRWYLVQGVRPIGFREFKKVVQHGFAGEFAIRNRALFCLQYYTGRRITQTLALTLADVIENGQVVERINYARRTVKKQRVGESMIVHPTARKALEAWIEDLKHLGYCLGEHFLFQAKGKGNRAISRTAAWHIYDRAFKRAGVTGRMGTHSLRKGFAKEMYRAFHKDIRKLQAALGHKDLNSTSHYLLVSQDEIEGKVRSSLKSVTF